jgi:DNA uptake protein ComE-like DNA-binding protein
MIILQRAICIFLGVFAALALLGTTVLAQPTKALVDPNSASESDLDALPHMTPAIVKEMIERRPYKTVIDLNKFLLEQKLTSDQARDFYRTAFVRINLNSGAREEFLLIPGVGSRLAAEFAEYRPWKTWVQFDKEIGKYVGQQETDRLKLYVFIPPS